MRSGNSNFQSLMFLGKNRAYIDGENFVSGLIITHFVLVVMKPDTLSGSFIKL